MLIAHWYHLPVSFSLGFIIVALAVTLAASFLFPPPSGGGGIIDKTEGKTGSIFGSVQPKKREEEN
jgi:hypothetical protein